MTGGGRAIVRYIGYAVVVLICAFGAALFAQITVLAWSEWRR